MNWLLVFEFLAFICCSLYDVATSCALALAAKKLIYVLDCTLLDGRLVNLSIHQSYTALSAEVGVNPIDGFVKGAMLTVFFREIDLSLQFPFKNFSCCMFSHFDI